MVNSNEIKNVKVVVRFPGDLSNIEGVFFSVDKEIPKTGIDGIAAENDLKELGISLAKSVKNTHVLDHPLVLEHGVEDVLTLAQQIEFNDGGVSHTFFYVHAFLRANDAIIGNAFWDEMSEKN